MFYHAGSFYLFSTERRKSFVKKEFCDFSQALWLAHPHCSCQKLPSICLRNAVDLYPWNYVTKYFVTKYRKVSHIVQYYFDLVRLKKRMKFFSFLLKRLPAPAFFWRLLINNTNNIINGSPNWLCLKLLACFVF